MEKNSVYLSIIIPAYNEEFRLPETMEIIYAYLQKQSFSWEVIIVLDGSRDGTLGVVENFVQTVAESDRPAWRWIPRTQNRGKGYTVREGMLAAKGEIRLFTDADNSTDITHFDKMIPAFEQGYDVVICSRDHKDVPGARQAVPQSFFKRLFGNLGNLFIQFVAVPGIWDTQCGFKAFSAESAQKIFALSTVDGWAFDIESLAIARQLGYNIGIVAAYWIDATGSHVKLTDYPQTILETIKIRWRISRTIPAMKKRQDKRKLHPLLTR